MKNDIEGKNFAFFGFSVNNFGRTCGKKQRGIFGLWSKFYFSLDAT